MDPPPPGSSQAFQPWSLSAGHGDQDTSPAHTPSQSHRGAHPESLPIMSKERLGPERSRDSPKAKAWTLASSRYLASGSPEFPPTLPLAPCGTQGVLGVL